MSLTDWPFDGLTPLKYSAILADPPWSYRMYSDNGHAKSPEAHYATMALPDIARLPVGQLAGPDCYLFLWSTWPHLPQALHVLKAWGFDYVTGGSWTKRTRNWNVAFGTGYVLRSATEPFLVGKIGRPEIASRSERGLILAPDDVPDSIEAIRREHSRKPVEMRDMISRLLPRGYFCELFGREPWSGHAVWGNQTEHFGSGRMTAWIDELERDLGLAARLRVIQAAGGQRRDVPRPENAASSTLAVEIGADATRWLADRFAGTKVDFPSRHGAKAQRKASLLRAAILDAGLTNPTRSANDLAREFGVTAMWVHKLRVQMRADAGEDQQLRLFD